MSRFLLFPILFAVVFSVLGLVQWYEYRAYRRWVITVFHTERHQKLVRWAWLVLGTGNLLILLQLVVRGLSFYASPVVQFTVVSPGGIYFAIVIFGFLILLVRDCIRFFTYWVWHAIRLEQRLGARDSTTVTPPPSGEYSDSRRKLLKISGTTLVGITFGTPLISAVASARDYRITKIPIEFPNLPAGLNGLTIAQVSDVHSGIYMTPNHMMEVVELTNSLNAQMVVLTGDHVDSSDIQIPSVCKAMKQLKSEYGVYGCLGNHDHFATAPKVAAGLEDVGIRMLVNANRTMTINGEQFSLIGVDDAGHGDANYARLDEALTGVDPQMFRILLSHRPEFFPHAKRAGIDLTLAGHTHGGQVGIEVAGINLNPAYLITKYVRGLFKEEGRQMYVNVGVGMVAVPIRIVRPEITLITLQRS
jgi:uncharacterized protein